MEYLKVEQIRPEILSVSLTSSNKPLEADPRVTVVPLSGFDWDTYSEIEERGLLKDVEILPFEAGGQDLHPRITMARGIH